MFYRRARVALFMAAAGVVCSCAKPEFTHRVAVLRFEDLSADSANRWIGRGISEEVAGQLEGTRHHAVIPFTALRRIEDQTGARPPQAPGVSTGTDGALAAGANRIITGNYSVDHGRVSITAIEENEDTHKSSVLFSGSGPVDDLLHLSDGIAHAEDDEARPPITGSARALRSYAIGLESAPDAARASFEEAVQLDPDFGAPYVALANLALARHDPALFQQSVAMVRARGSGVRPLDRALLNLADARLHGDAATTLDALGALARLSPADPFRLRDLADAELAANRYTEAADYYRKLAALLPVNSEPVNLLGYALMYSGDEAGSAKAFRDYRRMSHDAANALDSDGDGQFFFKHFDSAEKLYLDAYGKSPAMAGGSEPIKAAWCRLMRGDRTGALALVNRFLADRARAGDGLAPLRAAPIWRIAGQPQQAERAVAAYGLTAAAQLAWWRFLDGSGSAPDDGSALAKAVRAIAGKDFRAATPLWRALVETTPPADWWMRAVYGRCLQQTGQTQEAQRYLQYAPPPDPNRAVSFDELWFPFFNGTG